MLSRGPASVPWTTPLLSGLTPYLYCEEPVLLLGAPWSSVQVSSVFCEQLPLLLPHPPHQLSLLSSERDLYGPERGLGGFRQEIRGSQVTEVWPGGRSETQASGGHSHVTRWAPRSVGRAAAIGKPGQGSLWCGSQDRGPSCCDLVGALNVPVFEITFLLKSNYGLYSFFFTTCLLTWVLLRGFFLEI